MIGSDFLPFERVLRNHLLSSYKIKGFDPHEGLYMQ